MANTSRINGFKPVKHLNGSPYNGQANLYEVPSTEAVPVFVGDLVKLSDQAATSLYPAVEAVVGASAQIAAGPILGAVVGIVNSKFDPVAGALSSGSISLDTPVYRPASTKQFVLVCDNTDVVYEAEADASVAATSIGLNVGVGASAHTNPLLTGASPMYVYSTTAPDTTSTRPLQILGIVNRPDNEIGTNSKVLVRINVQSYGSVGVAGV
ncbi:hypothetical protein [uncultured Flavobacterium sp.]|jgi:hypothetical protein|uniref:hypothetical protein n=1 Tax=uncultured Flavobacterium sp. TaxID=165435 RepID=UPI00262A63FA|nr:hypothetical protein [uncultured Flavobacterium sp.]